MIFKWYCGVCKKSTNQLVVTWAYVSEAWNQVLIKCSRCKTKTIKLTDNHCTEVRNAKKT